MKLLTTFLLVTAFAASVVNAQECPDYPTACPGDIRREDSECGGDTGIPCVLSLTPIDDPAGREVVCEDYQCHCTYTADADGFVAEGCCPDPSYCCCPNGRQCAYTADSCEP